jgi:hypothetical protein
VKLKESFASERAKDNELIKVDLQFVIPGITIKIRFRAFIRNILLTKRV